MSKMHVIICIPTKHAPTHVEMTMTTNTIIVNPDIKNLNYSNTKQDMYIWTSDPKLLPNLSSLV